jgi:gas vesicle protein
MDNEQQGGSAAVGLAFLQGAVIGAIGALLLAPRSGREFRKQIKGYAQQTGEKLRTVAGNGQDALQHGMEEGRHLAEKGRQILREAAEAGQSAIKQERGRPS